MTPTRNWSTSSWDPHPDIARRRLAYPLFERSRTRNVCGGFCAAAALTEMNRSDSFDICMETTTLHAYIEGRPTNLLRKSCSSAAAQNLISDKRCGRERFTMRMCAAAKYSRKGAVVGLYTQHGPPPCSRMPPKSCVHSEASKSDAVALQKKVAATAVYVMCICYS